MKNYSTLKCMAFLMLRKSILFFFFVLSISVLAQTNVSVSVSKDRIPENDSLDIIATLDAVSDKDVIVNLTISGTATSELDYISDFASKGTTSTVAGGNGQGSASNQLNAPTGVSVDSEGNVYVLDKDNQRIMKWAPGAVSGDSLVYFDRWDVDYFFVTESGDIYIVASMDNLVQKWTPGEVSWETVAGGNGAGSEANQLNYPRGIFVDEDKNLFIADQNNHRIQKWAPEASVGVTVAGGNDAGSASNQLNNPYDVSVDSVGNIYVLDQGNYRIQKWKESEDSGININHLPDWASHFFVDSKGDIFVVNSMSYSVQKYTPIALQENSGNIPGDDWVVVAGQEGYGSETNQLSSPQGIFVDEYGNIFVADQGNHRIQKVQYAPQIVIPVGETEGKMTITSLEDKLNLEGDETIILDVESVVNGSLSGNTQYTIIIETFVNQAVSLSLSQSSVTEVGSTEISAALGEPTTKEVIVDFELTGTAISDLDYTTSFLTKGVATTIAGGNSQGSAANQLSSPADISVDSEGNVYIYDRNNSRIQKWIPGATSGITIATVNSWGQYFFVDSFANIYISDEMNNRVQKWTATDGWKTVAGGNDQGSNANQLSSPKGIYVDDAGALYIADYGNHRIQKWEKDATTGITVAGGNGEGWEANKCSNPYDVSVDSEGNIYVLQPNYNRIQKWIPDVDNSVILTYINGWGYYSFYMDNLGNVYLPMQNDHKVQKWTHGSQSESLDPMMDESLWVTVAGGNGQGSNSDQLNSPQAVSVDIEGNIYIADTENHRIQKVQQAPQIVIPVGETEGKLTISAVDDNSDENDETIIINPTNGANANLSSTEAFTVTITDDDDPPTVSFSFSEEKITENSETDVLLIAKTAIVSGKDIEITYSMEGDAVEIDEYIVSTKAITILAGDSTGTLAISTKGLDDEIVEMLESIVFRVVSITNATAAEETATLYLDSDDNPIVSFAASTNTIAEHERMEIKATLDTPGSRNAIIDFDLSGTAELNFDFIVDFLGKGLTSTIAGGNGNGVDANQTPSPNCVFVDKDGNIYIADNQNNRIQKWAFGATEGITVAGGNGWGYENNQLNVIESIFVDAAGNIFVADNNVGMESRIQKWAPDAEEGTTVAGGNGWGTEDNQLARANDIFVDKDGNIYIADADNNRIQKWAPDATKGITVAGGNSWGSGANQLFFPSGVSVDSEGNIYILDKLNNRIQKWEPNADVGTTVAYLDNQFSSFFMDHFGDFYGVSSEYYNVGVFKLQFGIDGDEFTMGSWIKVAGEGGKGSEANQLDNPSDVFVDLTGNIFIADQGNHRIQKVQHSPQIVIPAGETEGTLSIIGIEDELNDEEEESIIVGINTAQNANIASSTEDMSVALLNNRKTLTLKENPFMGLTNGAASWGDYDRDGDMDVAVMGQSPITGAVTVVYENKNGTFENSNQNISPQLYYGDISWVDINKDGWIDLVVSGFNGTPHTKLYINVDGLYFDPTDDYGLPQLFSTTMAWGDLDNDGDIDLAIAGIDENENYVFNLYYRENNENKFVLEPKTVNSVNDYYMGAYDWPGFINGDIKIIDVDLDGDNDIIFNGENSSGEPIGGIKYNTYIENEISEPYYMDYYNLSLKNSTIEVAKMNSNQNTLSILSTGEDSEGNLVFYSSNVLAGSMPGTEEQFPKLKNGDISIGDFDNNGLNDIVFTGEDEAGTPTTKLFLQDLNGNYKESDIELKGLRNSTVNWVDYDMDGDLDLFLTGVDDQGAKTVLYETEIANKKNAAPSKISGLVTEDLGNGNVRFSWDTPNDDYSSNIGYVLRLGTTSGGTELSNTESDILTGKRLISKPATIYTNFFETQLDPGVYYWSVQAIDPGLKGSEFSEETSFTLTYEWKILNQGGIIDRKISGKEDPIIKLADIDNDNDLDLIYGSASSSGVSLLKFEKNRLESMETNPLQYVDKITDAEVGDINGDGTPDILINNAAYDGSYSLKLYMSDDSTFSQTDIGSGLYKAQGRIIDLNNDGQSEVVLLGLSSSTVSGKLKFLIYEYDLTSHSFNESDVSDQLTPLTKSSFDLGDIDNDQDIDLIMSGESTSGYKSYIYENITEMGGDYTFQITDNNLVAVTDGTSDLIDIDGDGDLDAVFSGTSTTVDVFEVYMNRINEGSTTWPKLNNLGLTPMREGKVDLGDFNGDGYSDLLYSGVVSGIGKTTKLSEYDPVAKKFIDSNFDVSDIIGAEVEFGDFDGDSDLDFAISGENKTNLGDFIFRAYVNVRNESAAVLEAGIVTPPMHRADGFKAISEDSFVVNEAPTVPIPIEAIVLENIPENDAGLAVEFSWNASEDDHTPVGGLTYALKVGTTSGGEEIMSANANASGIRKTAEIGNAEHNLKWHLRLPPGVYYWSIQAVDASYVGSAFSTPMILNLTESLVINDVTISMSDTTEIGTEVADFGIADYTGESLTYSFISGNEDEIFEIASSTGIVKTSNLLACSENYELEVLVTNGISSDTAILKVNIIDVTKPTITSVFDNKSVDSGDDCSAILADFTSELVVTDNCDSELTVTQSPAAGTSISGSDNTVILKAEDASGNSSEISFNVSVVDNTNPSIVCISDTTINAEVSEVYTISGTGFDPISTDDNCGVASVENDFNNSSTLDGASLPVGSTLIVWKVTDMSGNSNTASFNLIINSTVGIDVFEKNGVLIYPNPTNGNITLEFESFKAREIKISDLMGRIMIIKPIFNKNEVIDLSAFEKGIYLISIQEDDKTFTTRIVKQ